MTVSVFPVPGVPHTYMETDLCDIWRDVRSNEVSESVSFWRPTGSPSG